MKKIILILFAFMLLAGLQCPKDKINPPPEPEPTLPPITTQGLNTVGCKIDGKVWVPYSNTSFPEFSLLLQDLQIGDIILVVIKLKILTVTIQ